MARVVKLEFKKRDVRLKDVPKFYGALIDNKLSVGFHKEVGVNILTKAMNTEFGGTIYFAPHQHYVTAPPRPIVRMYLYPRMTDKIHKSYSEYINDEILGGLKAPKTNAKDVLKNIGKECVYLQKSQIWMRDYDTSVNPYPHLDPNINGAEIVEYKGFDFPWIGKTGKTIEAINYKVRARG